MKKILPFAMLFLLTISSGCSSDTNSTAIVNTDIIGNWNWIESTGGLTGGTETPESTGQFVTLTISESTVKRFEDGSLAWEHPYTLEVQPSIFGGDKLMLVFSQDIGVKQSFEVTDGVLHLNDECADCYSSTYASF